MSQITNFLRASALSTLALLSATGCSVLEQDPYTALTPDQAFSNADRISKTATGMYDGLQNAEFLGGRALIYGDARSDDTNPSPFFSTIANPQATLADNALATNAWTGGYRTVYATNYFLQGIAANTGKTTAALEAQYIGEAKYIRALAYFHLVNLFAQPYNFTADASHLGVPIQLTAAVDAVQAFDPSQNLARSTVRQVYDQIEKDLLESLTGLPETYSSSFDRTGRATKDAARTLLSRMYLYKGDYTNAAKYSGDVISGARHALNSSPATPFTLTSFQTTESIFSVAMNTSDNPNTNNALGQHYYDTRRDITVTPYARIDSTQFRSKDLRRTLLLTSSSTVPAATALVYTLKYPNRSIDYVPIHRYSEVLLNRAEALAQINSGISTDAITLLNTVRRRSLPNIPAYPSYTAASFASKQALINAILFERRLELAFEGHRYYDLLRYKQNPPRVNYGEQKVVFPIPLVDIQQNPSLVQNPGY